MDDIRPVTSLHFPEPASKYVSLFCLLHFEDSCYLCNHLIQLEGMEGLKMNRVLTKGSVPTRDTVVPAAPEVLGSRRKDR